MGKAKKGKRKPALKKPASSKIDQPIPIDDSKNEKTVQDAVSSNSNTKPSKKPTSAAHPIPIDNPRNEDTVQDIVSSNSYPNTPQKSDTSSLSQAVFCTEDELYKLVVTKLQSSHFSAFCGYNMSNVNNTPKFVDPRNCNEEEIGSVGEDLLAVVKNVLGILAHSLNKDRPNLSPGETLWCLLTSNFDLSIAKTLELPAVISKGKYPILDPQIRNEVVSSPEIQKLFFTNSDNNNSNIEKPPREMPLFRKNIMGLVAMCREKMKETPEETRALADFYHRRTGTGQLDTKEDSFTVSEEVFGTEIISRLVHDMREAEDMAIERRDWAQKKVIEAAKKLGDELIAIRRLKMENKERAFVEFGWSEEKNLRILKSRQRNLANMTIEATQWSERVKALEKENAEIGAEIEAFKLRSSESKEKLGGLLKKEKKLVKQRVALEKQNVKLKREIGELGEKSMALQRELDDVTKAREDIEVTRRQEEAEAKAKLKEEQRLKQEAKENIRIMMNELRQETYKDSLKYKDYIELLEKNLANLEIAQKDSTGDSYHLPDHLFSWESEPSEAKDKDWSEEREPVVDRACLSCLVEESEVVFLPCCHQVLCASCDEDRVEIKKGGEDICPCCEAFVDRRIRVFGVRS